MCFFFLSFSASSWASFLFSSSWKSFKLMVINQFLASFEATFSSFSLGGSFSGSSLFKRPGNHANWSLNSEQFLQALLVGGYGMLSWLSLITTNKTGTFERWHLTWHFVWDHLGEESHGHLGRALPGEIPFDLYENTTRFKVSLVSQFNASVMWSMLRSD